MAKYDELQIGMFKYYNRVMRKHQKNLSNRKWKKWESRLRRELKTAWRKKPEYANYIHNKKAKERERRLNWNL